MTGYDSTAQQSLSGSFARGLTDGGAPDVQRPLDRLGIAGDRVAQCAMIVEEFLDRFAPQPQQASTEAMKACPPIGHNGNIARLFDNIERLETAVHQLGNIG